MNWNSLLISVLIASSGLWGAYSLRGIDQELRVIYAEYTLVAADLGHINANLIRYRTSILRAIEADTEADYRGIIDTLPDKRRRIELPLEGFLKSAISTTAAKTAPMEELEQLQTVKSLLTEYLATSDETIRLVERRWATTDPIEAKRFRDLAEENAAERGGSKFIAVTIELDRLLEVVAHIAGDARDEADRQLRMSSAIVVAVSFLLAGLVLIVRR